MEIYLDANATTPVMEEARDAALAAMAQCFGDPGSSHSAGVRARALMDEVRQRARRVLGAPEGRLLFVSGATEGVQTAVFSALHALRLRGRGGRAIPTLLLHGATEHGAVIEALHHWNGVLGVHAEVLAIPVGRDGRHDLAWLRERAPRAALVCTMAVNHETGVVSDLAGVAAALADSAALWLVDGAQALGRMPLALHDGWGGRPVDYAAFSGHKLHAPKGIGLLYAREGAPLTPLLAGGAQESGDRSGTENMPGIAALGAVLAQLESGTRLADGATLRAHRDRLAAALQQALPGLAFNAPPAACLPTTLNFSVPGMSSRDLLNLFDAAGIRIATGSGCSADDAQPSRVLQAMGVPSARAASAVRLSFGPLQDAAFIDEACRRIAACGETLRAAAPNDATGPAALALQTGVLRCPSGPACCYVVIDAATRRSIVIDPRPELVAQLVRWHGGQDLRLDSVLTTRGRSDGVRAAKALRAALSAPAPDGADAMGWPHDRDWLDLGSLRLQRLPLPSSKSACNAYLLHDPQGLRAAFVGDAVLPGSCGGAGNTASRAPLSLRPALRRLAEAVGTDTLLLPALDPEDHLGTTLAIECAAPTGPVPADALALAPQLVRLLLDSNRETVLIDVREPVEQQLRPLPDWNAPIPRRSVPLSRIVDALPTWLREQPQVPMVFVCRSGNRSARVAQAVRRLGHPQTWSLDGGLALWTAA